MPRAAPGSVPLGRGPRHAAESALGFRHWAFFGYCAIGHWPFSVVHHSKTPTLHHSVSPMTFLPIVARELRVQARQKRTFRLRLANAAVAMALVTFMLLLNEG